jgi:hypothetical protein
LSLSPGQYNLEVMRENFEPFTYELQLQPGDSIELTFILKTLPPFLLPPDSLGLAYDMQMPLLDETAPDRTRRRWTSAAEAFSIFPLAQGLLGRLFLGNDREKEANILIASGLVLSVGSLIVGKVASDGQRKSLQEKNEAITSTNESALLHNQEIDRQLRAVNSEREAAWQFRNQVRGRISMRRFNTLTEPVDDTATSQ